MILPLREMANWKKFHELFAAAFIHEALGAAAELDVAEAVTDTPATAAELAEKLAVDAGALYRVLRALAAYGIFEELEGGKFRHNSFSRQLRGDHPYSIQGMARLWHCEPLRKAWGSFTSAIRDGKSAFGHGNGLGIYEYLEKHPETAQLFHEAMENNSAVAAAAIAGSFPFGDYRNVVDLGGGIGTLLSAILARHPITGAVYDLPVVSEAARAHLGAKGLSDRAQFLAGDWFERVPDGFDVYVVKNSLWNWTDDDCRCIFASIRRALSREAHLLIVEYFPSPEDAPWSTAFDLQQLNVTGGRGRTPDEYAGLLDENGMRVTALFQVASQHVLQCRVK